MEPTTILIAGIAALAILVIAVGIAMSGGGSGVNARLERYASGREAKPAGGASGQGGLQEALQSSQAMAQLNKVVEQRDFGANLAREIARADLRLKVSEYLVIWAACIVGVPILMVVAVGGISRPAQPDRAPDRRAHRVHAPPLLAQPPQVQPPRTRSTSSCPTRSR